MPRSDEEIIRDADELADIFERYEPNDEDRAEPEFDALMRVGNNAEATCDASVVEAVKVARGAGMSWNEVGKALWISEAEARRLFESLVA